ncbi:hypothetical protein [Lysobacter sp. TAB13]|uniref:hypothetical protein n=1 Tax=Lysobacter sp. TAB13 TaxID=3233065 RepID=UPI003F98B7C5
MPMPRSLHPSRASLYALRHRKSDAKSRGLAEALLLLERGLWSGSAVGCFYPGRMMSPVTLARLSVYFAERRRQDFFVLARAGFVLAWGCDDG